VEHFEKDNDCNAHIDFITAASVSKKKNYLIFFNLFFFLCCVDLNE